MMTNWREVVFVGAVIVGLYALFLSMPIYSVPATVAYACGAVYAMFAIFRLKRDFHEKSFHGIIQFLARCAVVAVLSAAEILTTL